MAGNQVNKHDVFNWLKEKVTFLRKDIEVLKRICPETVPTEEKKQGPWSVLKLVALGYVNSMYTNIIGSYVEKGKYFKKMVYIDLFSGAGINLLTDPEKFYFLGSPFVAINSAKKPYSQLIFVDNKKEYINALEMRLNAKSKEKGFEWVKNYKTINNDINKAIDEIVAEVDEYGTHCFIFVDPYGLDPTHDSLRTLLSRTQSDLFINIMSYEAFRAIQGSRKSKTSPRKVKEWLGKPMLARLAKDRPITREKIAKTYMVSLMFIPNRRSNIRERYVLIPVKATSKIRDEPYYYLAYLTKKTKTKNPWLDAPLRVQQQLSVADENFVKQVVRILRGGQQTLF